MSPSEKPTVLFVHGAWHNPTCWNPLRAELTKHAYPTEAPQLISPGHAVKSHLEDTAVVRKALEKLIVSEGKSVILVMHSYGGVVGSNAVEGLELEARKAKGEKGGITRCIFIAAFIISKGMSVLGQFPELPPYVVPDPKDESFFLLTTPKDTFYNDCTEEQAKPWIDGLVPQSVASFASEVTSVAWGSGLVPCTYLICEKDQGVYVWLQEKMVESVEAQSARPWTVEKCDSSHSAWLTQVPLISRLIQTAAGDL